MTQIGAEEMKKAGEYEHEAVEIPQVNINPERFNTVNLQEEIAKGMQQILDATEKETVSDTMDNIKKMVEEIPYLQLPREEEEENDEPQFETDEEIDDSLKINFQEMIGEDSDGQMSMVVPEKMQLERQITGQINKRGLQISLNRKRGLQIPLNRKRGLQIPLNRKRGLQIPLNRKYYCN